MNFALKNASSQPANGHWKRTKETLYESSVYESYGACFARVHIYINEKKITPVEIVCVCVCLADYSEQPNNKPEILQHLQEKQAPPATHP